MSTKTLSTLFLVLLFCNVGFAESYYFKECKLSEELSGNYLIDFDKNVIKSTIVRTDGVVQELTDKIKSITKDHIVSEIIQNTKITCHEIFFKFYRIIFIIWNIINIIKPSFIIKLFHFTIC